MKVKNIPKKIIFDKNVKNSPPVWHMQCLQRHKSEFMELSCVFCTANACINNLVTLTNTLSLKPVVVDERAKITRKLFVKKYQKCKADFHITIANMCHSHNLSRQREFNVWYHSAFHWAFHSWNFFCFKKLLLFTAIHRVGIEYAT